LTLRSYHRTLTAGSHLLRYGTYSTVEAINAGLDLEMPGPTRWRGQLLNHAVMSKKVTQETVDDRVRQVLKFVREAIRTGIPSGIPEGTRDVPETAALLRDIAGEAIVLLKNDNQVLPFSKDETVSTPTKTPWQTFGPTIVTGHPS
jgi:beta-glucosidase